MAHESHEPHESRQAAKERAYQELIGAVTALGYPQEFGYVLARELGGEKSMLRMASYLRQARPTSPEQIADEMLTIVSQRRQWVQKKMTERANAAMTEFYNRPVDEDE